MILAVIIVLVVINIVLAVIDNYKNNISSSYYCISNYHY